jgi:hypothetical protein
MQSELQRANAVENPGFTLIAVITLALSVLNVDPSYCRSKPAV